MRLKNLLIISAILILIYGVGFLLAPTFVLSFYDISLSLEGNVIARLLGAAFTGFAVLNWIARESTDPNVRRIVMSGNFVHFAFGFLTILIGKLNGAGNDLVWFNVGLYLLLSLGFVYFQFKKSD